MSNVVIPYRFRIKRDTAANFAAANTLLLEGEFGLELDTGKLKIGDGVTAWNALGYLDTDDVPEGATNLYFTDARARAAAVADAINDGTTNIAPSQNAVFDGLALKFNNTGGTITGDVKVGATANSYTGTARTLSVSAGQSGDATGGMNIEGSRTGSGQLFGRFGFWHQGTLVASFNSIRGAVDEGSFAIASKLSGGGLLFRWQVSSAGHFLPWADNTYDHGSASFRSREIFCANATINTSDAREKTAPRDLTDAELACASDLARLPSIFQWLHAIEEKGDDARLHCSPTVQSVIACMEKHGLDPFRYGFVCFDEWDEAPEVITAWDEERDKEGNVIHEAGSAVTQEYHPAGSRYSLRPSELAHFVMRGLAHRLDALESQRNVSL